MIPVGYMYKKVVIKPEWLQATNAVDVYSLSNCISHNFADYINYWEHNGYWLFDSPAIIEALAMAENIDLSDTTLFYYEAYEYEYVEETDTWATFTPEPSCVTDVQIPVHKHLEGFDVTTFSGHVEPECSPLSCNALAADISVNQHCLFNTFIEAKEAIERGFFKNSEPGPCRIFAVYTLTLAET